MKEPLLDEKALNEIIDLCNGIDFLCQDNEPIINTHAIARFLVQYIMTIEDEEKRLKATSSMLTKIGLPLVGGYNPKIINFHRQFNEDMMFILKKYQHEISQGSNKK